MQVSLIIPVYQADSFIYSSGLSLIDYFKTTSITYEIIFVNDGSTDQTSQELRKLENLENIKIISLEINRGKFGAISAGVKAAQGEVCIFTDADLPFDLKAIEHAFNLTASGVIDVVAGDRRLLTSRIEVQNSIFRKIISTGLAHLIRLLFTGGMFDTQCGFKAFRTEVAKIVFPMIRFQRFAGDIEVLYICLKHNLCIRRIPVRFINIRDSTVRPLTDIWSFFWCLASLKINWLRGIYHSKELETIGCRIYW